MVAGRRRGDTRAWETSGVTDVFIILNLVMASPGYTYVNIQKIVHFKYLKFIVY